MPTKKKRVYFIPNERTAQALERLAAMGIGTKGRIVADLIEAQVEHIEGLVMMGEKVAQLNQEGVALIRDASQVAASRVLPQLAAVDQAWHELMTAVESAPQKAPV